MSKKINIFSKNIMTSKTSLQKAIEAYMEEYKEKLSSGEPIHENGKIKKPEPNEEDSDKKCDGKDLKLLVYNVNGNSNEVEMVPGSVSVSKGSLSDLNNEHVNKIINSVRKLEEKKPGGISRISIPIYIININNILSNGNKNNVSV